jgi:hypothetical protein
MNRNMVTCMAGLVLFACGLAGCPEIDGVHLLLA